MLALSRFKLIEPLNIFSELLGFPLLFPHFGKFLVDFGRPSHLLQQRLNVRPALKIGLFEPVETLAVVGLGWKVTEQVELAKLDLRGPVAALREQLVELPPLPRDQRPVG